MKHVMLVGVMRNPETYLAGILVDNLLLKHLKVSFRLMIGGIQIFAISNTNSKNILRFLPNSISKLRFVD